VTLKTVLKDACRILKFVPKPRHDMYIEKNTSMAEKESRHKRSDAEPQVGSHPIEIDTLE
jgi:hypothetical protein